MLARNRNLRRIMQDPVMEDVPYFESPPIRNPPIRNPHLVVTARGLVTSGEKVRF